VHKRAITNTKTKTHLLLIASGGFLGDYGEGTDMNAPLIGVHTEIDGKHVVKFSDFTQLDNLNGKYVVNFTDVNDFSEFL
jgi:hypothetical protein